MDLQSIPIVAVAISVVICWSLFSLFCSFVQEAIAQIKGERGRYMKKYLFKQFYDQPNGVNWASMLYMHGSVDLLTRAANKPTSDIHPRIFAETLIDVVGKAHITQINKETVQDQLNYQSPLLNNFKAATLCLQQSDVVGFFQQAMTSAEMMAGTNGVPDESAIYKSLVDQVEQWHGEMMQRLSIWYKKKTKVWLFVVGSLLAIIINVDSIQLFGHFSDSPASRKVMMDYYEANADRLEKLAVNSSADSSAVYIERLGVLKNEMDSLAKKAELPVGIKHSLFRESGRENRNYFLAVLGFLLSGFAASAGAPFWFELLKKAYSAKPQKN